MAHVKNVVSYSRLVDICTGYGGSYNPGHQNLQLSAMRALLSEAQSSLHMVTQKRNAYNSIVNDRAASFANIDKLANRVVGTLASLQVSKATLADARYFTRLITGKRATPRPPIPSEDSDTQPKVTRSFSQQSYDTIASNFLKLVKMVEEMPVYVSNEPELQVPALIQKSNELQELNEAVHRAKVALKLALLHRDRTLYKGKNALVNIASAIKQYIRVVFGTRSGEAAQLASVSFRKPKVK